MVFIENYRRESPTFFAPDFLIKGKCYVLRHLTFV
nr:MAG TPA: hypothetical protein [Podoviridae sp. ctgHy19]